MSRRAAVILLAVLLLAVPVFAQLPVGRVIPTDNFTVGHIVSAVHVAGIVQTSAQVQHVSAITHVVLIASGHANVIRDHRSGSLRTLVVSQCGGSAVIAIGTNPNRRDLILQNGGTTTSSGNIFIGFGTQGHVALSVANGFVLHTNTAYANASPTSRLIIPNYQGPVACIADAAGSPLQILEILR